MSNSLFKIVIWITVRLYRLTNGRFGGRMMSLPVLLLTTTGRKSGKQRIIPIAYLTDGPNYVLTASAFAVLNRAPGWYLNLKSHPRATVQVQAVRQQVIARVAEPQERGRLWAQLLEIAPGYGEYQKRLNREIPMLILQPLDPSQEHN
jgi:deazaflavin-dependent oxidoreductase (nitroreductase family)